MKKFFSLILALTLLTTTAFATAADTLFAALEKTSLELTGANFSATVSTKLNQPLSFLSDLPEDEYTDIDWPMFIESLADATAHMEGSYVRTADKKKLDSAYSVTVDVPLTFSEDLTLSAWTRVHTWSQYDLTDTTTPFIRTIVKNPMTKMFQVTDVSEDLENAVSLFDPMKQEQFQKEALAILKNHADVGYRNNLYTVHFTDVALREYLKQLLSIWKEYTFEDSVSQDKTLEEICEKAEHMFTDIPLLGEKGLSIQYQVTPEGWVKYGKIELHLCTNFHDILTVLEANTNGLDYESAWIDLTVFAEETIKNHNKVSIVSIPEVNEDNAYFSGGYDSYAYSLRETPIFTDKSTYYPIEKIAEHYQFSLMEDGEIISITTPNGNSTVSFRLDDTVVTIDGEEFPCEFLPAIRENDKFYCSEEIFRFLGIDISASAYGASSNSFRLHSYYYESESDFHGYDEYPSDSMDEYQPRTLYYDIYYDRMPPIIDGQCYMPLYEFLLELTPGEFSYGDHSLTFTATGENPYALISASAAVGNSFITWNDTELELSGPVLEQDGIMYIPASFPKPLGINIEATIRFYKYGPEVQYHWFIENPAYTEGASSAYVPYYLYFYISSDQMLYMKDERIYIPAYDLFAELTEGNFTFEENLMTFTATDGGANPLGIQTLSVASGDDFVTVNGEQILLDAPAEEINQVLRIPVSFAEYFGFDIDSIRAYGDSSHFTFSMKNPGYQQEDDRLWYEF